MYNRPAPRRWRTATREIHRRQFLAAAASLGGAALGGLDGAATARADSGGAALWRYETGGDVSSSPTAVDGTVFFGSQDDGVYALDAATGAREWRYATGANVYSSPTVVDGTLYVGSADATIYALDVATGDQQWAFSARGPVDASPTVADGTVFVGSWGDEVHALDAATGEEVWQFETGGSVDSSATVVDGTVLVGSKDASLHALDSTTGEQQWAFPTGDDVDSSPTVSDGTAFVGSADGNVYAIDAATGEEQWRYRTGGDVESSPTVADGTVFVGGGNATIYALDAASGDLQWQFQSRLGVESAPTVAGDTVFVGSVNHALFALDAATGEEVWTFDTDSVVDSSPTVVDGVVFFGTVGGSLVAVEAGVDGSSRGSRVLQGTLGHHHEWAGESPQTIAVPDIDLSVEHLRLVQTVEHTRAVAADPYDHPELGDLPRYEFTDYGPASERLVAEADREWITWTALDPDVVAGRRVAPVFDLRVEGDRANVPGVEVTARVVTEGWSAGEQTVRLDSDAVAGRAPDRRRELEEEYLLDPPAELPLLDVLAGPGDHVEDEYPTFPAFDDLTVELAVDWPGAEEPLTERVTLDAAVEPTPTLTVGLVGLENAGDYAFEDDPELVAFAERVGRFLLATYPTTAVGVAVLPTPHRSHVLVDNPGKAAGRARRVLAERIDDARTFLVTAGGERHDDHEVRSVDVTLGVMPDDWGYDGGGVLPTAGRNPLVRAALTRRSRGAQTAAHEAGHFFLGTFYGDASIPSDGATHVSEEIASTCYDVQGDGFDVLPGRGSIVGGSSPQRIDAVTYQRLIDGDFEPAHPVVAGTLALPFERSTADTLADADAWAAAPDEQTREALDADVGALRSDIEELRTGLDAAVDDADHRSEDPRGLSRAEWRRLRDVATDVSSLGETLQAAESRFLEDAGTTTAVLGRRLADAGSELADRAATRLDAGVEHVLVVSGELAAGDGSDLRLDQRVVPVLGPVRTVEGDGTIEVLDADGAVLERAPASTAIDLVDESGDRRRVDGVLTGAVALPEAAATVRIDAETDDGPVETRLDPTTDPIRALVEALPERALAGDDRTDTLATVDRVGELARAGRRDAAASQLRTLHRDLDAAIPGDYAPESAGEPTRRAVLARVDQQRQRFDAGPSEQSGRRSDLSSGWIVGGLGGAALGGYALRRLRAERDEEVAPE